MRGFRMRRVERDQDQGQNQKSGWESNPGPETETEPEPGEELLENSIQKMTDFPFSISVFSFPLFSKLIKNQK